MVVAAPDVVLRMRQFFWLPVSHNIIANKGGSMTAYVIATMVIHDPQTYLQYTELTPPLVARHGGKFLTRGDKVDTYEGDTFTERMVLLEFPDRDKVYAWLKDPEYVAASEFRKAASVCRILIQEGASNTGDPDPKVG
ncbi:hypothetical protein CR155_11325 [Pollutimonas nitritireducens]|uniref:DUF1330 domain-containing protein n=2 Tax=Pollutimonas nitritireducens TaxID=2045209 RepID=A0A2N4UG52_9BURK|nr:hypothetical protein CR155_11325 [Pollutimonas nitritireducens]